MTSSAPDEVETHIKFMQDFAAKLERDGEFVDARALSPDGVWVRSDGEGRPALVDGPFAETKDRNTCRSEHLDPHPIAHGAGPVIRSYGCVSSITSRL